MIKKYRDDFRYYDLETYLRCDLTDNAKMQLWNAYCDKTNNTDDYLYSMDDIDNFFGRVYISEFLSMMGRDFNYVDNYFYIDGNGNVNSTSYPDSHISFDDMIYYILDKGETFGDEQIELILDAEG